MSDKEQRKAPVLRFKGFTDDWEQRKLGDKITRIKSYSISHGYETMHDTNTKYIHYGDIHTGKVKIINDINILPNIKDNNYIGLNKGDIVVADASEDYKGIADACLVNTDTDSNKIVAGLHTIALRPQKDTYPQYLYTYLSTDIFKHFGYKTGTGLKVFGISYKELAKFLVSSPSIKEQKEISKLISLIEKNIDLQQQKNADIINLKKAILDKIFSNSNIQKWRDIRLNKVLSIPVDEPKEVTNIDDIISVKLNTQGISKIPNRSTLKLGSTKYYVRHGGQFIFGKQNFFNGSMAIIPSEYDGKVSSKDVPSLNINKDIVMPYFLWLYLSRPSFYKKTERWATGTGSKRLHIKDLLSLKIYIPNKNEQLRICKLMQSLDTQILKSQKHLKELQSIKKFLLQNMFI